MPEFIFQIDDSEVRRTYAECDNYLIETDPEGDSDRCAVYFSSNDLYYPNNSDRFHERVVRRNVFEWYGTRVPGCRKHIFIRDIFKQWYLGGINSRLDTPEKIRAWLADETCGYRVTMVGSSAGGYAAALFGSQLGAERVFSFNGYFDLVPETEGEHADFINPLLVRYRHQPGKEAFYRLSPHLHESTPVYYIHSLHSPIDRHQKELLGSHPAVHTIPFRSSRHGIPFLKCCLEPLFACTDSQLLALCERRHCPLVYTWRRASACTILSGLIRQTWHFYRKRH